MSRYLLGFAALMMASIATGYVWSRLDRPEEQVADSLSTAAPTEAEAADAPVSFAAPDDRSAVEASVTYAGCNEVRALGKAPLHAGEPGYRTEMDGDLDGVACEPIRPRSF